jgi:hypothetical protein
MRRLNTNARRTFWLHVLELAGNMVWPSIPGPERELLKATPAVANPGALTHFRRRKKPWTGFNTTITAREKRMALS